MAKRRVFRLRWSKRMGWHLEGLDSIQFTGTTKVDAVISAASYARAFRPSQLVVHNRDGRIAFERTYGRDPERSAG